MGEKRLLALPEAGSKVSPTRKVQELIDLHDRLQSEQRFESARLIAAHRDRLVEEQSKIHPAIQNLLDTHFPNRCECSQCACQNQLERWNYHLCDDCATDQHSERRYA